MIDKNEIANAIVTKLINSEIVANIGYENEDYKPPTGATLYVLVSIIPVVEVPDSRCTEGCQFAIDFDFYVEADNGGYGLRDKIKNVGNLFNPLSASNAYWIVESNQLNIVSVEEVKGAKTDDGWYYSTLRLNLKITKSI